VGSNYAGGINLDPQDSDIVYLSREYGESDFRVEQWTRVSGTWTKTADISGDTGGTNARPVAVDVNGTTHAVYWSGDYDHYTDYDTEVHVWPEGDFRASKPSDPTVDADFLPAGT